MRSDQLGIMYHLVGEQSLPIFMAAAQFTACKHVLCYTERSEKTCANLCKVMHNHQLHVQQKLIGAENVAWDIPQLSAIFSQAFRNDAANNAYIGLNATGGTKLMSLVSLMALQDSAPRERIMACYVDSKNRKLLSLLGAWTGEEIQTQISIEDFLGLASAKVHSKGLGANEEALLARRELVMGLWRARSEIQGQQQLMAFLSDKHHASMLTPPDSYLSLMAQWPLLKEVNGHPSFKSDWRLAARFLAGGWFEEYCFWKITSAPGHEKLNDIRLGLTPTWQSATGPAQEFDVCYTDGLSLFILECKAGKLLQDYVQKLENICTLFSGSMGRAALVSLNHINRYKNVAARFRNSNNLACFSGEVGVESLCEDIWRIPPGLFNRVKTTP